MASRVDTGGSICEPVADAWCRAEHATGFGAEFPSSVRTLVLPEPAELATGVRARVRFLAAQDAAGIRYSLTCNEYLSGAPDPRALLSDYGGRLAQPFGPVEIVAEQQAVSRDGIPGRRVILRHPMAAGALQVFVGPDHTCVQVIEAQDTAPARRTDIERFFDSLVLPHP